MATLSYVNLFLIIGILIFLIVIAFAGRRQEFAVSNISWIVQQGAASGATDTMLTGGNNFYIGNSSTDLTLTVAPAVTNTVGRQILIKNNSMKAITAVGGTNVTLNPASVTINPSDYAWYVATGTNNFLRVNE